MVFTRTALLIVSSAYIHQGPGCLYVCSRTSGTIVLPFVAIHVKESTFIVTLLAFSREIANSGNCMRVTSGRCLRFSADSYRIFIENLPIFSPTSRVG